MPKRIKRRTSHASSRVHRTPKVKTYPRLAILVIVLLTLVGLGYVWVYYNKINVKNTEQTAEMYEIKGCPKKCEKEKAQCIKDYPHLKKTTCRTDYQNCCTNAASIGGAGSAQCWCTKEKECSDKGWTWNNDPYCRDYFDSGAGVYVDLGCCTAPGEPTKAPMGGGDDCLQTCAKAGMELMRENSCESIPLKPYYPGPRSCQEIKTITDKKTCCCTKVWDCADKNNSGFPSACKSSCVI